MCVWAQLRFILLRFRSGERGPWRSGVVGPRVAEAAGLWTPLPPLPRDPSSRAARTGPPRTTLRERAGTPCSTLEVSGLRPEPVEHVGSPGRSPRRAVSRHPAPGGLTRAVKPRPSSARRAPCCCPQDRTGRCRQHPRLQETRRWGSLVPECHNINAPWVY